MRFLELIYAAGCLLFLVAQPVGADEASVESNDQYLTLSRDFSGSVRVELESEGASFEFCPDNTCDLIKASKAIHVAEILDFGFLYEYYFSDYYVLHEWRKKAEPTLLAKRILDKPQYATCRSDKEQEQARCVLKRMSTEYHIALYAVRYDEDERHIDRLSFP